MIYRPNCQIPLYHMEIFSQINFTLFETYGKDLAHKNPCIKTTFSIIDSTKLEPYYFFFPFFSILLVKKGSFWCLWQLLFILILNPAWAIFWSMTASFKLLFLPTGIQNWYKFEYFGPRSGYFLVHWSQKPGRRAKKRGLEKPRLNNWANKVICRQIKQF